MDRERHLTIRCCACNHEVTLGNGMCPGCGVMNPEVVVLTLLGGFHLVKEADDAELHGVGTSN
mgnify:CR=1 FL=1